MFQAPEYIVADTDGRVYRAYLPPLVDFVPQPKHFRDEWPTISEVTQ